MNFSLDVSVPALTVFFQGLLSFLSAICQEVQENREQMGKYTIKKAK